MTTNEPKPEIAPREDDEAMPRYSFDLVTWLDKNTAKPLMPVTAGGFAAHDEAAVRQAAFTAGVRSLVNSLVEWRDEEYAEDEDNSISDGSHGGFERVLRGDGDVLREVSSIHVDG